MSRRYEIDKFDDLKRVSNGKKMGECKSEGRC
jgi:hypothetical protein